MATVGYTNIGANTGSGNTNFGPASPGLLITMPEAGSITSITAYCRTNLSTMSLACRIYAGTAGARGAEQAVTNNANVTTSFGWVQFNFASPFAASATTYWLQWDGTGGSGPGTNVGEYRYDSGGAADSGYVLSDLFAPLYNSNQYSIYATYTPAGGETGFNIALI